MSSQGPCGGCPLGLASSQVPWRLWSSLMVFISSSVGLVGLYFSLDYKIRDDMGFSLWTVDSSYLLNCLASNRCSVPHSLINVTDRQKTACHVLTGLLGFRSKSSIKTTVVCYYITELFLLTLPWKKGLELVHGRFKKEDYSSSQVKAFYIERCSENRSAFGGVGVHIFYYPIKIEVVGKIFTRVQLMNQRKEVYRFRDQVLNSGD